MADDEDRTVVEPAAAREEPDTSRPGAAPQGRRSRPAARSRPARRGVDSRAPALRAARRCAGSRRPRSPGDPYCRVPRMSRVMSTARMRLSLAAVLLVLVSVGAGTSVATTRAAANPIQRENALPGSTGWRLPRATPAAIDGYASQASLAPGDQLHLRCLHVACGPVQGRGLPRRLVRGCARRIDCVPACDSDDKARRSRCRAFDPATGYLAAGWPVTAPSHGHAGLDERLLPRRARPHRRRRRGARQLGCRSSCASRLGSDREPSYRPL